MIDTLGINLCIGHACFTKCNGCYNHFSPKDNLATAEDIVGFLRIMKENGLERVTISGGDPLSRTDILPILRGIKELGLVVSLDTVGTPLLQDAKLIYNDKGIVPQVDARELVKYTDFIGIPLEGTSSFAISNFRTGRQNIFEEQMEIIGLLSRLNANIVINTVVHQLNKTSVPQIQQQLEPFSSIAKWQVFQYMPIGELGYRNRKTYRISDEDFATLAEGVNAESKGRFPIEFKSRTARKGKYLFVDAAGTIWIPELSDNEGWTKQDDTNKRVVLGNISDIYKQNTTMKALVNFYHLGKIYARQTEY